MSPASLANKNNERREGRSGLVSGHALNKAAGNEVTARRVLPLHPMHIEEDEGPEAEIEAVFRRKLTGLRRLPRRERPHALRAAREERMLALKTLRDKRARERHAEHMLRRLLVPTPR